MKRLFVFIAGIFVLGIYGCNSGKVVKMDNEAGLKTVRAAFSEYVALEDHKPILFWWQEARNLSNDIGSAHCYVVDRDGIIYNRAVKMSGDDQGPREVKRNQGQPTDPYNYDAIYGLSVDDINSELFFKHLEAAKEDIPEDFAYKSLKQYRISINPHTGEREYYLIINIVDDKVNEDGKKGDGYSSLEYDAFADGTVKFLQ